MGKQEIFLICVVVGICTMSLSSSLYADDSFVLSFTEKTYSAGWGPGEKGQVLKVFVDDKEVMSADVGNKPIAEGDAGPLRSMGDVRINVTHQVEPTSVTSVLTFRLQRDVPGCGAYPILVIIKNVRLEKNGEPLNLEKFQYKESKGIDLCPGEISPWNAYNGGQIDDTIVLSVGNDFLTDNPEEYKEIVNSMERAGQSNALVLDEGEFGEVTNLKPGEKK